MDFDLMKNNKGETLSEFLRNYKPGDYERPSNTVDILIFTIDDKEEEDIRKVPEKELKLLLIKRGDHPFINQWALPGGFVNINENLDDAALRELKEETNVDNVFIKQMNTWGTVNRDPRMRVISTPYFALVPSKNLKPIAGDDASDIAWFTIKRKLISDTNENKVWNISFESKEKNISIQYEITDTYKMNGVTKVLNSCSKVDLLSSDKLAFDHIEIVKTAMDILNDEIKCSPIAFNLLDTYFTISDISMTYKAITGSKMQDTALRRLVKDMIIETEYKKPGVAHKPPKYFTVNPNWKPEK